MTREGNEFPWKVDHEHLMFAIEAGRSAMRIVELMKAQIIKAAIPIQLTPDQKRHAELIVTAVLENESRVPSPFDGAELATYFEHLAFTGEWPDIETATK